MKTNLEQYVKKEALYPSINGMIEMVAEASNPMPVECGMPFISTHMERIKELIGKAPADAPFWFMPSYGETYDSFESSRLPEDCNPDFIKEVSPGDNALQEYYSRLSDAKQDILSDWEFERDLKWPWYWACTMALGPFWGSETCVNKE
ncbi:hypothetical protein VPAG_00026 [Vibrio phage douglas 12A4]|uniref:hypothetical protein n=1 Tax=Vibrio phage douglas 12A4 TaxID=573171 RepID=UPI0002C0D39C|nr:hypothetical protein VPAG_00026 [Vibrio phage douglas 12A4]AGG58062.1 hypothetical protein VPAG_00026 [Vibrio phage douglas 12A4]